MFDFLKDVGSAIKTGAQKVGQFFSGTPDFLRQTTAMAVAPFSTRAAEVISGTPIAREPTETGGKLSGQTFISAPSKTANLLSARGGTPGAGIEFSGGNINGLVLRPQITPQLSDEQIRRAQQSLGSAFAPQAAARPQNDFERFGVNPEAPRAAETLAQLKRREELANIGLPSPGVTGQAGAGGFVSPTPGAQGAAGGGTSFPTGFGSTAGGFAPLAAQSTTEQEAERKRTQTLTTGRDVRRFAPTPSGTVVDTRTGEPVVVFDAAGKPSLTPKGQTVDMNELLTDVASYQHPGIVFEDRGTAAASLSNLIEQRYQQNIQQAATTRQPMMLDPATLADNDAELAAIDASLKNAEGLFNFERIQQEFGIPQALKDMEDLVAIYKSTDEAFDIKVGDIRGNPDFPVKLAERRIKSLEQLRDKSLKGMELALKMKEFEINQKRELFRERIDVNKLQFTQAQSRQERFRDNVRNQVQQLISSGAIADLSDQELAALERQGGYNSGALKVIRSSLQKKKADITNVQFKEDAKGNVTAIGLDQQNRPIILGTLQGIGTPSGGGVTTGEFKFTQDQLQKASASASIPLHDLKKLPGEIINIFTSGAFDDLKKRITKALDDFEDPSDIEGEISSDATLPPAVKDALVRYLKREAKSNQ